MVRHVHERLAESSCEQKITESVALRKFGLEACRGNASIDKTLLALPDPFRGARALVRAKRSDGVRRRFRRRTQREFAARRVAESRRRGAQNHSVPAEPPLALPSRPSQSTGNPLSDLHTDDPVRVGRIPSRGRQTHKPTLQGKAAQPRPVTRKRDRPRCHMRTK